MALAIETKKEQNGKKKFLKNIIKNFRAYIPIAAAVLFAVCILGFFGYSYIRAKKIGTEVGVAAGNMAGRFVGSFEGVTKGLAEGAEEGKEAGLSAVDTEAKIGSKIQAMGELEVLSSTVVLHDLLEIGDDYKTLVAFYGEIIFTVDLNDAEIIPNGNNYEVILPTPKDVINIDDEKTLQIDSFIEHNWSGSNKKGYKAAMNSIKQLKKKSEEYIANYDYLKEVAENSAKKQVEFLIQSATKEDVSIHVRFKEDSEN